MGAIVLGVLALGLAASGFGFAATLSVTAVKVTYWPNGTNEGMENTWTLRCDPAGGTLAHPQVACRKLAAGGRRLFAPVPRRAVCTEIYGGADEARIIGVVEGRSVWVRSNLTNGCNIDRWHRFSPWLLPQS